MDALKDNRAARNWLLRLENTHQIHTWSPFQLRIFYNSPLVFGPEQIVPQLRIFGEQIVPQQTTPAVVWVIKLEVGDFGSGENFVRTDDRGARIGTLAYGLKVAVKLGAGAANYSRRQ
jgi:hypothetical protein